MRIRRIAPEVCVGISDVWQTTMTVYGAQNAVVIDGPVSAADMAALGGIPATHVIATHGDWDHLLAPLCWPHADRLAGASTVARMRDDGDSAARDLDAWDAAHGVEGRWLPDWTGAAALPAPGRIDLPAGAIETVATSGHTPDGIAVLLTGPEILVAGDYVSPCEIPSWERGGAEQYLATLGMFDRLVASAKWTVPGHGWPVGTARARSLVAEDRRYVEALLRDGDGPLPRHRGDTGQQRVHQRNRAGLR